MKAPRSVMFLGLAGAGLVLGTLLILVSRQRPEPMPVYPDIGLAVPSPLTSWPWKGAAQDTPHRGVTHWMVTSSDGTDVELLRFDFKANPGLRLEIYSQDEDDAKPWDNSVQFWQMGVGQATRHLNQRFVAQKSPVVAVWNGPFFGYYHLADIQHETAFHLSPLVLGGKVHYNTSNHRWTFGVKETPQGPTFKAFHLPGRAILEKEFDFATGSLQDLVRDGKPLKLAPFPTGPTDFQKAPVPSTSQDVGHIPYFDHAKFSRTSFAWSKDNRQFYLLVVREPKGDTEGYSIYRLRQWQSQSGGWNVPDLQRFWLSMCQQGLVWNAMNSDAGDAGQMTYLLPDGNYELVSPVGDNPSFVRRAFTPTFQGAPQGGSLSYYYIRDTSQK